MAAAAMHQRSALFWAAFIVILATAAYSFYWVFVDIASRLGASPSTESFDAESFTAELTIWNDIAFYTAIAFTPPSLYLFWRGHNGVLITYAFVIIARVVDWILLLENSEFNNSLMAITVYSGQLFVYVYLVAFALRKNPALR